MPDYRDFVPPAYAVTEPDLAHLSNQQCLDLDICLKLGYPVYFAYVHGYPNDPVQPWIGGNRLPNYSTDPRSSRVLIYLAAALGCDFHVDMETTGATYCWFRYETEDSLARQTFAGYGATLEEAVARAFLTLEMAIPPELVPAPRHL